MTKKQQQYLKIEIVIDAEIEKTCFTLYSNNPK